MTELVWMKTYIGTETSRTIHLTAEEFGAYERIRRHYWEHHGVPNDDRRLMRITGVEPERWDEVRSAICGLFEEGWQMPALDAERDAAAEKRVKAVERSQKAAGARWGKNAQSNASSNARSNASSIPTSIARGMPEAVPEAVLEECPSASASDEVRYDERLAPTHVHAREALGPVPIAVPETDHEGRDLLIREGLWPKQVDSLLPLLMAGRLQRAQINEMLARKRS